MDRGPLLHSLAEPDRILRALFQGLLASLLLLADGYVLILVSRRVGLYLLLAVVASTGLLAIVVAMIAYRTELDAMWRQVHDGTYPRTSFRRMIALLTAAVLLIIPGLVTDAMGVLLLIRPVGWLIGLAVEGRHRTRFRELYEYLRLRR